VKSEEVVVEFGLEAIKIREGSTSMGLSNQMGVEGGGFAKQYFGVSTKGVLAVDWPLKTQQYTML